MADLPFTKKRVVVRAFDADPLNAEMAKETVNQVLILQSRLWNALVEIDHTFRREYLAILAGSDPTIAILQRSLADLHKVENATTPEILAPQAALERARIEGDLKKRFTEAKRLCETDIRSLEARRKLCVSELQTPELWWCHRESVMARHESARSKSFKEGTTPNFHSFNGEGSLRLRFGHGGIAFSKIELGQTTMVGFRCPTPNELGRRKALKADGGSRKILGVRVGTAPDGSPLTLEFLVTISGRGRMNEPQFGDSLKLKMVYLNLQNNRRGGAWRISFIFSGEEAVERLKINCVSCTIALLQEALPYQEGWLMGFTGSPSGRLDERLLLPDRAVLKLTESRRILQRVDQNAVEFWQKEKPRLSRLSVDLAGHWFEKIFRAIQRSEFPKHQQLMSFYAAHQRAGCPLGARINLEYEFWYAEVKSDVMRAYDLKIKSFRIRDHCFRNVAADFARRFDFIKVALLPNKQAIVSSKPNLEHALLSTTKLLLFLTEACAAHNKALKACSSQETQLIHDRLPPAFVHSSRIP